MASKVTPRVVIVGAGFGGLNAARTLAKAPVQITVIDRRNYHTFQPLLYQVATAGLSPGEIAAPIRSILRSHRNIEVLMSEVTDFDLEHRIVKTPDAEIPYDYLIVAAGASHAYFGHDDWEPFAPSKLSKMRWKFAVVCCSLLSWLSGRLPPGKLPLLSTSLWSAAVPPESS